MKKFWKIELSLKKDTSYRLSLDLRDKYFIELQLFLFDEIFLETRIEEQILNNIILVQNQKTERINNKIKDIEGTIKSIESDGDTQVENINNAAEIKASTESNKIKREGNIIYYNNFKTSLNQLSNRFPTKDYFIANLYLLDVF